MFAEVGEGLLGAFGLAEAHQGLHKLCPREWDEVVRRGEAPGQLLGGPEGSRRVAVSAERQLELPADVVDRHRVHWLDFGSDERTR